MKEMLIKMLIALNLMQPTPQEQPKEPSKELVVVSEKTSNYSNQFDDEWYGKAEYGKDYYKEIVMKNEQGNEVNITIDTWKDVYTMSYTRKMLPSDIVVNYHYHNLQDLQDDIKLHQKNINEDFKNWEEVEEIDPVRSNPNRDFSLRVRKQRVDLWLRIEEGEEKQQLEKELKMYNGFDVINGIDYELILGEDWKCLIHTEEGKERIEEFKNN